MKFLTLTLILITTSFVHASNCWRYLAESKGVAVSNSLTDNFIAFLDVMLSEYVIDDDYLTKLSKGEIMNPLIKEINTDSNHHIYKDIFQEFIDAKPDTNRISQWAAQLLQQRQQTQTDKKQTQERTKEAYFKMEFHRIEPGSYVFNKHRGIVTTYDITLTEPFEMMSTPVTQKMWKDVMGSLPPQIYDGNDYPVGKITWWSMLAYANELSKKHNLPEVYNFSAITEWEGSVAEGTWKPKSFLKATQDFIINAPNNDIYLANGYRLPTIYEAVYVASDRGRSNNKAFTNIENEDLKPYVYHKTKHDDHIRPVADGLPFIIDGKKFYDLYGNAYEILYDHGRWNCEINSGTNPVHTKMHPDESDESNERHYYRLMRSSGASTGYDAMSAAQYSMHKSTDGSPIISFRLVRSLGK